MLDDEFNKQRASLVRDLASRADPFIKRRLLDLASRYEKPPAKIKPLPIVSLNDQVPSDRSDSNDGSVRHFSGVPRRRF
ncbi:hypothetical protein H8A97_43250, partial [Bradyrhizobium sp. Arg62]|uniref:hypothetical protein n=1 Tax=Bradyrhizobium brasilense TaxID=1419277 RepID=UPI001E2E125B